MERPSTGTRGSSAERTADARDDAQRVIWATTDTNGDDVPDIYAQHVYDVAGRLVRQWGFGYLASASSNQAYSYAATSGLKTAEDLLL